MLIENDDACPGGGKIAGGSHASATKAKSRKCRNGTGPHMTGGAPALTGPSHAPIAASRRAVPLLDMVLPEAVPSPHHVAALLDDGTLAICRAAVAGPALRKHGAMAALAKLTPDVDHPRSGRMAFMIETGEPADVETHDAFFRIHRLPGDGPAAFLLSLFRTLAILRSDIEETPTRLAQDRLATLAGALCSTIAFAVGGRSDGARLTLRQPEAPLHADHSARRWLRGHQIFAALSQCIILALNEMERAEQAGEVEALKRAAGLIAELFAASAVSLELTGDFSEQDYRTAIRVSMENPFLPRGFSGLLSNDHRHLVSRMKALRPTIDSLRAGHPDLHASIMDNLAAVYASHSHVCARFVGPEQSSLLMSQSVGRSAVAQIDRFKAMRLRSWAPTAPETTR